ncbi:radical SAM superfamily protein [Escherichia coli]|uniref:Radical SAM superfamily protein n=1 Tax=Escherichia coli TaxID=562 RepID=A0A2X1JH39_ECOLX|nr:radical SAM superfamily protein [Escherichia coli]
MSKVTPQPKIGFVSLGCPKNLVDSERILTELRTEGYDVVPSYDDADMVIVNTCGFIDSAVQESLEAIGEALNENGKVIVTGCLGAKEDQIREVHPKVLEITGPHSYEQVSGARSSLRAETETQPIPEPGARTRCETDAASLCLSENF